MYRSAELSKFEAINLEHSSTGSILRRQPEMPLDEASSRAFQGLLLAIAASTALALAGLMLFTL